MVVNTTHGLLVELERSARRREVLVNGCSVCWRQWGKGPALVLVHGGSGSWMHWARNIPALSSRYTVWAVDLPGFGDSDEAPGHAQAPERQQRLVELTRRSLDRLVPAAQEIVLVGFSFGGLVASQLTALRGGVGQLVLLGPAGHGVWRQPAPALMKWRALPEDAMADAMRHNLAALMLHSPQAIDGLAVQVQTHCSRKAHYWSKPISLGSPLLEVLAGLDVPMHFIWGEHDATAEPERLRERLLDQRSERTFEVLPSVGHWVQYEAHQAVNRLLLSLP